MYAGNETTLNFTAKNSDGTVLNLTGLGIEWALARTNAPPILLSKSLSGGGITVLDAVAGRFSVPLLPADTKNLNGGYYHEARVTDGAKPYTVFAGSISFEPTIL